MTTFSERLILMCSEVIGAPIGFNVAVGVAGASQNQNVTIDQSDQLGIPLKVDNEVVFRLLVSYRCNWQSGQHFFAVEQSSFTLRIENVNEPLVHFDYVREAGASIPVAHVNVHAHRDELVYAMMNASRNRGKTRSKQSLSGKIPRIATLHIPMGGHRFRPSLEDILQMMILEFGIDRGKNAQSAIDAGRQHFRSIQVSAAVSDDAPIAAESLRRLGYTVIEPVPSVAPRADRLRRY